MKLPKIVTGKAYKVKANTAGHSFTVGDTVTIIMKHQTDIHHAYGPLWQAKGVSGNVYWVYSFDLLGAVTREERVVDNLAEIAELEKQLASLKAENERLSKWKTDEEETANMLVQASDSSKSPEERVAILVQILKERSATNGDTNFV